MEFSLAPVQKSARSTITPLRYPGFVYAIIAVERIRMGDPNRDGHLVANRLATPPRSNRVFIYVIVYTHLQSEIYNRGHSVNASAISCELHNQCVFM